MSLHQHYHRTDHQVSRLDWPCLVYGSVGFGVGIALQLVGLFKQANGYLLALMHKPVFHGANPETLPLPVLVCLTGILCYGVAFVILDTAGTWRRLVIGVTVLVLVVAMVPTLAVWKIYFPPFLPLSGVFWTWFCAMMYVNHHVMPCEHWPVTSTTLPIPVKEVDDSETSKAPVARLENTMRVTVKAGPAAGGKPVVPQKKSDKAVKPNNENFKYQPKEVAEAAGKEAANG